jgi:hypothetical protein
MRSEWVQRENNPSLEGQELLRTVKASVARRIDAGKAGVIHEQRAAGLPVVEIRGDSQDKVVSSVDGVLRHSPRRDVCGQREEQPRGHMAPDDKLGGA